MADALGAIGRPRPELRPDISSFAYKGFVIFHRYFADELEVVNVLEGHRDVIAYFRTDVIE